MYVTRNGLSRFAYPTRGMCRVLGRIGKGYFGHRERGRCNERAGRIRLRSITRAQISGTELVGHVERVSGWLARLTAIGCKRYGTQLVGWSGGLGREG